MMMKMMLMGPLQKKKRGRHRSRVRAMPMPMPMPIQINLKKIHFLKNQKIDAKVRKNNLSDARIEI